jgi:hypothetical protein
MFEVTLNGARVALCNSKQLADSYCSSTPGSVIKEYSQSVKQKKTKGQLLKEEFRSFLNDKWYEHQDEIYTWEKKLPQYNREYYWRKHKWLLKNMFKEQKRNNESVEEYRKKNAKKIQKELKRGFKKGNL